MQLEIMDNSTDNESMNKFNSSSKNDEFNFCSDLEEQRESGDGDSGGESKESSELERNSNKDCQTIKQPVLSYMPDKEYVQNQDDKSISEILVCESTPTKTSRDNEDESSELQCAPEGETLIHLEAEHADGIVEPRASYPDPEIPGSIDICDNSTTETHDVDEVDSSKEIETASCYRAQVSGDILGADELPVCATPESDPSSLGNTDGVDSRSNPTCAGLNEYHHPENVMPIFCSEPDGLYGIPKMNLTPLYVPAAYLQLADRRQNKVVVMQNLTKLNSDIDYVPICKCIRNRMYRETEIVPKSETLKLSKLPRDKDINGECFCVIKEDTGDVIRNVNVSGSVHTPTLFPDDTIKGLTGDLPSLGEINGVDEVDDSPRCSLFLYAPLSLTDLEVTDMKEEILEAPEEFRSDDPSECAEECFTVYANEQVNIGEPEERRTGSSYRNHDNAYKAETGDTIRRTEDKDTSSRGSESRQIRKVNDTAECNFVVSSASCDRNNGDVVIGDNDHVQADRNNAIMTVEHVGSALPQPVSVNNNNTSVDETVGMDEVACVYQKSGRDDDKAPGKAVDELKLQFSVGGCAPGPDAVNVPGSTARSFGACMCAPSSARTSIGGSVAKCAQALGCSRVPTATVCAAPNLELSNTSSCAASLHTDNQQNIQDHLDVNYTKPTPDDIKHSSLIPSQLSGESVSDKTSVVNNTRHKEEAQLCWKFKNGRLVFENVTNDTNENESTPDNGLGHSSRTPDEQVVERHNQQSKKQYESITSFIGNQANSHPKNVLLSKNLNKKVDENKSRLKYLEQKLKEAGIVDDNFKTSPNSPRYIEYSKYRNDVNNSSDTVTSANREDNFKTRDVPTRNETESVTDPNENEDKSTSVDTVDFTGSNFCEFDVREVDSFSDFNGYCEVYDELDGGSDCEGDNKHLITEEKMRGDGNTTVADGDKTAKHNPDKDNLKSSLKKPGKTKDKKNRSVIFNENKNEFFDADYIILIREECDYDDEDDDGICTCNQHEMVRLQCCEPNCNCSAYEDYDPTPQSPKFAPPLEFVDAVTLSPPEGYKDMELGEQQLLALQQMARRGQKPAVCRECSASHEEDDRAEDEGEGSLSDGESENPPVQETEEQEEKEKTDQSQQTTPTTPPNADSPNSQRYILETITMTTVSEQRIIREVEDERKAPSPSLVSTGSPISGILKGGRLWKQQSLDANGVKPPVEPQQTTDSSVTSDEEGGSGGMGGSSRRSVRFIESEGDKRDSCDGAPDNTIEEDDNKQQAENAPENVGKQGDTCNNSVSPESTEMMLTFKLGNHVLISNNSLKPNSAVRQLFPCTKPLAASGKAGEEEPVHQYLVTAESLRAFEEAKRSKLPQIIQSGETDESIKRAIERNTLRRSLIRYEPRSKKAAQKADNSLEERIKQLTCDVDDVNQTLSEETEIPTRVSPTGEEARKSPDTAQNNPKPPDKSFSPSSSSTASSSSSSMSSTYKKLTDLFAKREKTPDNINESAKLSAGLLPDLGNGPNPHELDIHPHMKGNPSTNESRKQFLSTLAPLTACVSGVGGQDEHYYHISNHVGERTSVGSSVGTEYCLEDIEEGLKNAEEDVKRITPDVLAGTPSASESGDELAMFVQQDASRMERIKKKYQPDQHRDEDDEHDDYGFNKRPSVRGIKPRFSTTTEILQQIQNQLQPPTQTARVAWPYYSESGLTPVDNTKTKNINQNMQHYHYPNVPEEVKARNFQQNYRPTSLPDETIYQNCTNQKCVREVYKTNVNSTYSSVVRIGGGGCNEYYQSLPRNRNGRPQSPPPLELSKNFHQTMVYIPYNHLEGYQPIITSPSPYYHASEYSRVNNQNQINKRYIEPIYQQRIHTPHPEDLHYPPNMLPPMPPHKPVLRPPYPSGHPPHLVSSRSESPLPGQFSTARATQTPAVTLAACYYPTTRYRPVVGPIWQGDGNYVTKVNRHSFPASGPRYAHPDNISLTDSESQHSVPIPNGFRQSVEITFSTPKDSIPNSPTKPRFIERGVPEGAASVSPQDSMTASQSTSTMTSPTSPQNPPPPNTQKPLFYAMNV